MQPKLHGIHHVTGICADAQQNVDFYSGLLGLRVVKITVNFDDPSAYHLYYGDGLGRPGTLITYFPYGNGHKANPGNGMVTNVAFAVPENSIDYWKDRLERDQVSVHAPFDRFGERTLAFEDPDGIALTLVETRRADGEPNSEGKVSPQFAIRGIRGVTLTEEAYESTAQLLGDMGFERGEESGSRYRFEAGNSFVDLLCQPDGATGQGGHGSIHHVAFRVPDSTGQTAWRQALVDKGLNVSPVMDRTYFKSIYYREPGGVLFEIATDGPGMAIDEPVRSLGHRLMLPPQFEDHRQEIERILPELRIPEVSQV